MQMDIKIHSRSRYRQLLDRGESCASARAILGEELVRTGTYMQAHGTGPRKTGH